MVKWQESQSFPQMLLACPKDLVIRHGKIARKSIISTNVIGLCQRFIDKTWENGKNVKSFQQMLLAYPKDLVTIHGKIERKSIISTNVIGLYQRFSDKTW